MQWQATEFILKGVYLGLLLFVALQEPGPRELGYVAACTFGGLLLFLAVAAWGKFREGYRPRGRWTAFTLFLLLESPGYVYAGVLLGLAFGAFTLGQEFDWSTLSGWQELFRRPAPLKGELLASVGGGAALGVVFWALRRVQEKRVRRLAGLGLVAALVGGAAALFHYQPTLVSPEQRVQLAYLLLMGIPLFYLLTFASLVEESEVEIAAICAALGVALWILGEQKGSDYPTLQVLGLVLAGALYYVYTQNILPGLRVFKHVLRGVSYASVGRYRWALISLGRAVELDPKNALAKEAVWGVHREMDFDEVANDPETLAVINFELCLERAGSLLLTPPKPDHLHEATRLLDFVATQKPGKAPQCDYWRAVAHLHQKQYEEAAQSLTLVLSGADAQPDSPSRRAILLPAWQLALSHGEMKRRAGLPQLEEPGRRMEAISVAERQLEKVPGDAATVELKKELYAGLKEADYDAAAGPGQAAAGFDHKYAQHLGMQRIGEAGHWRRGAEYLRLAARGLPEQGPSLFVEIAKACERNGDVDGAWANYERAKQVGQAAGPKNLSAADRMIYFQVVKMLADSARESGEVDRAIENYRLYTESEQVGIETYRALAELYEKKGDTWQSLYCTELGLAYNGSDADLVERKDKYYYSVTAQELGQRKEVAAKWFDNNGYLLRKAKWLLEKQGNDPDILDWANHLLELAAVLYPDKITVQMLRGRIKRLRGEIPEAIEILEQVKSGRPEKFANSEEEESWYTACRLLGDIYLPDKADKALECFLEYRKSPRSGADTLYKLGVAYEHLGDRAKAAKCYEQVLAYEKHPRAPEARYALERLRQPS